MRSENKLRIDLTGHVWPRRKVYKPCPTYITLLRHVIETAWFLHFSRLNYWIRYFNKISQLNLSPLLKKKRNGNLYRTTQFKDQTKIPTFFHFAHVTKIWGVFHWFSNYPWSYKKRFSYLGKNHSILYLKFKS